MNITVDMIMEKNPCSDYPRERIEELFGGKESVTPKELAEFKICRYDRLWGLLQFLPDKAKYARRVAFDVFHYVNNANLSIKNLGVLEEWLITGNQGIRDAAAYAANDAAAYAANDSYGDAAVAAANAVHAANGAHVAANPTHDVGEIIEKYVLWAVEEFNG